MRRIAMQGDGVAGTLTAVPDVAGAAESPSRARAHKGVARAGAGFAAAESALAAAESALAAAQSELAPAQSKLAPADAGLDRAALGARAADGPRSREGIVACLFDAFSRRELLRALPLLHPDVIFQPMTAEVTRAGEPYRGHAGIRSYTEDIASHWEELTLHPAQIRAAGRAVVVLGLVSGSGAAGSFENAPTTWVIKFKEDLVYEVQIFSDARHVVEALVGEEQS